MFHCFAMSENRTKREQLKANFEVHFSEDKSPSHYAFERVGNCVTIIIPHRVLLKCRELKQVIADVSYLELLKVCGSHLPFMLKDGNEMVEEALRTLTAKVYSQSCGLCGATRVSFLRKTRSLPASQDELLNVSTLKERFKKSEKEEKKAETATTRAQ